MTTFLYQFRVLTHRNIGCGIGVWIERTRLTETFAVNYIIWQKLLITLPAKEKGGTGISDFPLMASLINKHMESTAGNIHFLSFIKILIMLK